MMIKEKSLENFGHETQHGEKRTLLTKLLSAGGKLTYAKAKPILIVILIVSAIAIYGITRIEINDNPVKWFSKSHPIRKADIELNEHFSGTYMAYLVLDAAAGKAVPTKYISDLRKRLSEKSLELKEEFPSVLDIVPGIEKVLLEQASIAESKGDFLDKLTTFANDKLDAAEEKDVDIWYELADFFELEKERIKLFKQPEVLRYISQLQEHLEQAGLVGKSNSVADVVKKVHQELKDGRQENYKIPDSTDYADPAAAVAECLFQFQSSHKPDDLWHLVTTDYMHANIWMQLPSGDNKDMEKVIEAVDEFFAETPAPVPLKHRWAGLT
jgi:predicted RND superfamily exporter protein